MLYEHLLKGFTIAMEAEDITSEAQQTHATAKPFSKTGGGADDPTESNTDISTNVDNIYADDSDGEDNSTQDDEEVDTSGDESMDTEEDDMSDSENIDDTEDDTSTDEEDLSDTNPEDEAEHIKKENMRKNYIHLKEILEYNIDTLGDCNFDVSNDELRNHFSNIRDNFSNFYDILTDYLTERFKDAPYEDIAKRYVTMKNLYETLLISLEKFVTAASTIEEKTSKQKVKK